eukprot:CAMPEP_0182442184 /NCGR_PEP_ID=MMETSP1172-20130603/1133_1 /TAXON_ID=708627 /ORGANISM="Timspurckia oligopyrenoides, Strain CCMP3278" /LENGTH=272 /DNA_ID=CAMNT_0024636909 /DNA_START=251 /DNA_END=1069 /DNA_ORIENTATION=-
MCLDANLNESETSEEKNALRSQQSRQRQSDNKIDISSNDKVDTKDDGRSSTLPDILIRRQRDRSKEDLLTTVMDRPVKKYRMESSPKLSKRDEALRDMLNNGQRQEGENLLRIASVRFPAPKMVILVGIPGSGKTHFCEKLVERGWARISQDELGNRFRCEVELIKALLRGQNVAIDRCNFDEQQRYTWLRCGLLRGCRVGAIMFAVPLSECISRVISREGHETLPPSPEAPLIVQKFATMFHPPSIQEGFAFCRHIRNEKDAQSVIKELCD